MGPRGLSRGPILRFHTKGSTMHERIGSRLTGWLILVGSILFGIPAASITVAVNQSTIPGSACAICNVSSSDLTGMGAFGFSFRLHYNPAILRFDNVQVGCPIACGYSLTSENDASQGILGVVAVGVTPLSGAGVLAAVRFCNVTSSSVNSCDVPLTLDNITVGEVHPTPIGCIPSDSDPRGSRAELWHGMWAAPNPFSSSITVRVPRTGSEPSTWTIADVRGRILRHAFIGQDGNDSFTTFVWDGRDDRGSLVPTGAYFVRWRVGAKEEKATVIRMNPATR